MEFEAGSCIAKIGYDEKEIAMGRGERERNALALANQILGVEKSPKLIRYYKNYEGFPGYITFLELLPGEVLPAEIFNEIAATDKNIAIAVSALKILHSHKSERFDELTPNSPNDIYKYFTTRFDRIKATVEEAGLDEELSKSLNLLPKVFDYFREYSNSSFIHGDLNFKNVLVKNNELTSLIDWDRSLIAPIGLEFAQVGVLTEKYGVSNWHKKLTENYIEAYDGDGELLQKEILLLQYFVYFLLLSRKLTHIYQKGKVEICAETGEELKDHFIRKIKEYKIPTL